MNKIVLITGAGTGIGKSTAFSLSKRGHKVIATTETEEQSENLKTEAVKNNIVIEVFKLDITLAKDRELVRSYDIDVLINNAGVGETGSLSEIPMERIRHNFEVNVFGAIELTQIALQGIMKKGKGTVIFVSSLAGRSPSTFLNPYSMTKFALSGGIPAMREEIHRVAPNVHITLVEPGAYATGFNQRMLAKKYEWMKEDSYFFKIIEMLKKEDIKRFALLEEKSIESIVRKIVKAVESSKPRLRYVSPWYQGFGIFLLRLFR